MKSRSNITAASVVCLSVGLVVFGGPLVHSAPLNEELTGLLNDHPRIRAAKNTAASARASIDDAKAGYLPRLEFSGDTGYERTDSATRRGNGQAGFSMRRDKWTFTLTQNLFNGFRDEAGVNAAEASAVASDKSLDGTQQQLLLEGITAYLDVLRNSQLIAVAKKNETTIKMQLELEDERVQRGSGITVDVLQAKSRLQVAKEQRVAFEGRLKSSLAAYKQVFNHAANIGKLEDSKPPAALLPKTLKAAIRMAEEENPQLHITRLQSDVAREQRRIANADYYPSLDLVGSVDYEDNVGTSRGIEREQSLLLRARWEFFSGFRTRARVEAASRAFAASKDNYNFARRKVEEELKRSWDDLQTQRQRVSLLRNAVNIAEEVFAARAKLREAGKGSQLDVLDAQSEVFSAQINLISADFDSRIAVYTVALNTGILTPAALGLSK